MRLHIQIAKSAALTSIATVVLMHWTCPAWSHRFSMAPDESHGVTVRMRPGPVAVFERALRPTDPINIASDAMQRVRRRRHNLHRQNPPNQTRRAIKHHNLIARRPPDQLPW